MLLDQEMGVNCSDLDESQNGDDNNDDDAADDFTEMGQELSKSTLFTR